MMRNVALKIIITIVIPVKKIITIALKLVLNIIFKTKNNTLV